MPAWIGWPLLGLFAVADTACQLPVLSAFLPACCTLAALDVLSGLAARPLCLYQPAPMAADSIR
eukprot:6174938-Pleurochrysis_carterae.AAC.3